MTDTRTRDPACRKKDTHCATPFEKVGSNIHKYGVVRVSNTRIVIMVSGICLLFGYWDPSGFRTTRLER